MMNGDRLPPAEVPALIRCERRVVLPVRSWNTYWPYMLPLVFTVAVIVPYVAAALPDWNTEPAPTASTAAKPQPPAAPAIDGLLVAAPPPAVSRATQATPRPVRIGPRRRASGPRPPQLPALDHVGFAATAGPAPGETGPVTAVVGDASGVHVYRSSGAWPVAATGPAGVQMPTGGQLDAMEFVINVSPGSIEELVRNLDGAFLRKGRLHDARGNSVLSMDRFSTSGRMIVFYSIDGAVEVVLPNTVVENVLRQVAIKAAGSPPRRITARFDASGKLQDVDVEV